MKKKILLTTILAFTLIIMGYTISNAATYETDAFKVNIPNKYNDVEVLYNEVKLPARRINNNRRCCIY